MRLSSANSANQVASTVTANCTPDRKKKTAGSRKQISAIANGSNKIGGLPRVPVKSMSVRSGTLSAKLSENERNEFNRIIESFNNIYPAFTKQFHDYAESIREGRTDIVRPELPKGEENENIKAIILELKILNGQLNKLDNGAVRRKQDINAQIIEKERKLYDELKVWESKVKPQEKLPEAEQLAVEVDVVQEEASPATEQPTISGSEAEQPVVEAVIVPEAIQEQPVTIPIGDKQVTATPTEANKYKLTWPGDGADGGVIVEIKGENDFLITNANGTDRNDPGADESIKQALGTVGISYKVPASETEIEPAKAVAPITMGIVKLVELTAYEKAARELIAAYKDINRTEESLTVLKEAKEAALTALRSSNQIVPYQDSLLKQVQGVIHLADMERRLKLAEKALRAALQANNSKPEGDRVIDNSLLNAIDVAKDNVDGAKNGIMNSLGTEETEVLNTYLDAMDVLDPASDKDTFAKAFEAREKAMIWAVGKLEDTRKRNPILDEYLFDKIFSPASNHRNLIEHLHKLNNQMNAQLNKLEKSNYTNADDSGELRDLLKEILRLHKIRDDLSHSQKGVTLFNDFFDIAKSFLKKINSEPELALLKVQIELADEKQAREALEKQFDIEQENSFASIIKEGIEGNFTTVADELDKANNRLDDLGRTTADELSKTKTELGKTETKVSGLETELGKRVTMPVAGGLAAIAGLVGAGLSYFGLKPTVDKAVTDAIKASNTTAKAEDSKKKKAMV